MSRPSALLLALAPFFLLAVGCAQTPAPSHAERFADYLRLNQPAEEHDILNAMVGSFEAEVKTYAGPDTEPIAYEGLIQNRLVLGDRFLESRYRSDLGEYGVMEGIGLMGFNTFQGRYESLWVDTFATIIPPIAHGHADPETRELRFRTEGYDPQLGRVVRGRSVIRVEDRHRHVFEMYTEDEAGEEFLQVHILYTRL